MAPGRRSRSAAQQDACLTRCGTKEPDSIRQGVQVQQQPWDFSLEVLKSLKVSDNLSESVSHL
jgi:hypothetical protein